MLDKFAEELHEAREKSGISLQQIALKTKIDIKFLDAIDKGDFTFLAEPYVKAFIKEYAKMVGLDETKTLQKFEAARRGKQLEEKAEENQAAGTVEKKPEPKKNVQTYDATPAEQSRDSSSEVNKNIIRYSIFSAVAIVIFLIIYFAFFKSSNEIVVAEKPIEDVIQENRQRFVEEEPQQEAVDNTAPVDSFALTVFSSDTSWIKIIYDDAKVGEFTLFPNSQKTVKARDNFKLIVGNSGGVKFQLDNKPVNFVGKAGSIKYVQIDKNGVSYLQTPPTLINE